MSARVVKRYPWALVKLRLDEENEETFDVWRWNVYKLKWVRMSNTACGYSSLADAAEVAAVVSQETATMLVRNREPPRQPS
jgi:hypothetical protein